MGTNSQQGRKKDLLPFQLELKDRTVSLELYPVLQGWSKLSIRYSPGGNFMQVNAILGVDISKKKFDACLLINNKERHKVFHNNKEGFEKLVTWCNNHGAGFIHLFSHLYPVLKFQIL